MAAFSRPRQRFQKKDVFLGTHHLIKHLAYLCASKGAWVCVCGLFRVAVDMQ